MTSSIDLKNICYLPLDIEISAVEIAHIKQEIDSVEQKFWYFSKYRSCWLLPIYTGNGKILEKDISEHQSTFTWTEAAQKLHTLQKFFTEKIFNWMKPIPRLVILKTEPGKSVKAHVDCNESVFDELQHKFRIVVNGPRDSLYFYNRKLEKIKIQSKANVYILDGSHYHGADNEGSEVKYTICAGNPWNGQTDENYKNLIQRSLAKFSHESILRNEIGRPYNTDWFK